MAQIKSTNFPRPQIEASKAWSNFSQIQLKGLEGCACGYQRARIGSHCIDLQIQRLLLASFQSGWVYMCAHAAWNVCTAQSLGGERWVCNRIQHIRRCTSNVFMILNGEANMGSCRWQHTRGHHTVVDVMLLLVRRKPSSDSNLNEDPEAAVVKCELSLRANKILQ